MAEVPQDEISSEKFTPGGFNPLSDEVVRYVFDSASTPSEFQQELNTQEDTKALHYLQKSLSVLSLPPRFTTVRVNLQKTSIEDAVLMLEHHLSDQCHSVHKGKPEYVVYPHPTIADLIVIESHGLREVAPKSVEITVGQHCGSAVLRGADVFAPGVLGATPGLCAGEQAAVFVDLDNKCLRGTKVYNGRKMFIGNGTTLQGRLDLFRVAKPTGLAVVMEEKVFDCPSLGDFHKDLFFLQNLPSVLCSYNLGPEKSGVVLDMCAAPGGKTTHLASLVGNLGKVIAIDRSQRKINQIKENAERWGLTNISAFVYDSTKLVCEDYQLQCQKGNMDDIQEMGSLPDSKHACSPPPYLPSSFRWILLDAPCSALGYRPQILTKCTTKELKSFPIIQRKLLKNAIRLLRPGGTLVYSTCTIVAEENEKMVKWMLDNFSSMELIECQPRLGQTGLRNCGLSYEQARKVQRFGPLICNDNNSTILSELDSDTIGFFIASFRKKS